MQESDGPTSVSTWWPGSTTRFPPASTRTCRAPGPTRHRGEPAHRAGHPRPGEGIITDWHRQPDSPIPGLECVGQKSTPRPRAAPGGAREQACASAWLVSRLPATVAATGRRLRPVAGPVPGRRQSSSRSGGVVRHARPSTHPHATPAPAADPTGLDRPGDPGARPESPRISRLGVSLSRAAPNGCHRASHRIR